MQSVDNYTTLSIIYCMKYSVHCANKKQRYCYLYQPCGQSTVVRNQHTCLSLYATNTLLLSYACSHVNNWNIITPVIRCVQGNQAAEEEFQNANISCSTATTGRFSISTCGAGRPMTYRLLQSWKDGSATED